VDRHPQKKWGGLGPCSPPVPPPLGRNIVKLGIAAEMQPKEKHGTPCGVKNMVHRVALKTWYTVWR